MTGIDLSLHEVGIVRAAFTIPEVAVVDGLNDVSRALSDATNQLPEEADVDATITLDPKHAAVLRSVVSIAMHNELHYIAGLCDGGRPEMATARLDSKHGPKTYFELFRKVASNLPSRSVAEA